MGRGTREIREGSVAGWIFGRRKKTAWRRVGPAVLQPGPGLPLAVPDDRSVERKLMRGCAVREGRSAAGSTWQQVALGKWDRGGGG
jgi:hypothetical protein